MVAVNAAFTRMSGYEKQEVEGAALDSSAACNSGLAIEPAIWEGDRARGILGGRGPAGDQLLQIVTERLKRAVREKDTISRFGGDEFGILLKDIGGSGEIAATTRRLGARPALSYRRS